MNMNMKMIRSGWFVLLLATAMNVKGVNVTDTFGVSHDFKADGVAGTIWDGFFYNVLGGNTTVAAADANISNAGRLTLRSTNGSWENGDNDGILLYKTVSGDFDVSVQVISMNNPNWHDAGLMARVANLADAGAGEDWVAVKYFACDNNNGHRSVDDNATTTSEVGAPAQPWLRLTRVGDTFTSYRSTDGSSWSQISATTRADMNGLAVQVGIWEATFSGNEGDAQFDNFSLRLPSSWNLGTGGSWTTSANWANGLPGGQGEWATFSGALLSSGSVTLDGSQTMGRLSFANAASYSIEPGSSVPASTLVIDDANGGSSGSPSLEVDLGTHTITAPVILSNGVTVTTSAGAGLRVVKGFSGNGSLTKKGPGTLALSGANTYSGDTQVQGGTLKLAALADGIQVCYKFDNPANLGQDSSVWGNDLSAVGTPVYTENGKYGGAAYLDGGSHFMRSVFPTGVPTGGSAYTIALWEKDDGSGNTGGFAGWGVNGGNLCNNFRLAGANALNNYWWGNDWELTGLSANPKDGSWHHVAITWDGATQTLYVDGSSVGTSGRTGLNAQPTGFVVGKTTADITFKGWLDNVQIANRALGPSEIVSLMNMNNGNPSDILPVNSALQVSAGAALDLGGADQALAGVGGAGRVMNSAMDNVTLTVGSGNANTELSGTLDGAIALNKVGTGALTLSGVNAYSGGTTVSEGTLVLQSPSLQALLAGSVAWFDASDAATLTTNEAGQVTLWTNKGTAGAALNAVQINAGVGPTVAYGALNGKPVLSVDGTTALRTQNNLGIAGAQDRTLFVVGDRKNNGTMFFAHVGDGWDNRAFGIASHPEFLFSYTWGNDILFEARPSGMYELYDYMIASSYSSAKLISGGTIFSGSRAIAPATADTPLYLGSRFDATCQGNLAEVIVFNRALTPAERMWVEAYLRAKWLSSDGSAAISAGRVAVAAGAVLDLNGTTQTLSGLSGSGVVTNGTLAVNGAIAPGGANAVGTLTLTSVVPLGGTLLTDVALDGTSDLLNAQGPLNLSGLSLQIQDLSQLKSGKRYVIATCTPGGLTGTFTSSNLNTGRWTIHYNNTIGEVRLISRGLLVLIN